MWLEMLTQAAPGGYNDTRVAAYFLDTLVQTATNFVNQTAGTMSTIVAAIAGALLTIYVIFWGLGLASGKITEPFTDGMTRVIRMSLIVSLALSAGIYQSEISNFFLNVPQSVAAELIGASGSADTNTTALAKELDTALGKGIDMGNRCWQYGDAHSGMTGFGGIGYYLVAILIYISVGVIVAVATGIIFVAFIALALLLAIGPLFILCALFQSTQRFFDLWIGQCVSFAILFILVGCAVSLCFEFINQFITKLPQDDMSQILINMVKVVGACIATAAVLLQTRQMAAALGGGVAVVGQGIAGRLGGAVMGAGRTARGSGRAVWSGDSRGQEYRQAHNLPDKRFALRTLARATYQRGGGNNSIRQR